VIRQRTFQLLLPGAVALSLCCAAGCQPETAPARPAGRTDLGDRLKLLEEPQFTWHTVEKGDTFFGLARRYGVPMAAIAAANPQIDAKSLRLGDKVMIPGTAPVGSPSPAAAPPPPAAKPPAIKTTDRGGKLCYPSAARMTETGAPTPGMSFAAPAGATVVSAAAGTVVLAAPDLGGLGPTVIVDHGSGLCTLYGKLSDYAVSPGQKLSRGEALGRAGAAGLVFRVYEGADVKAPKPYLSK
jgi:murein DD-endopeptidase MepM/ murein hydrolase activator NlpD